MNPEADLKIRIAKPNSYLWKTDVIKYDSEDNTLNIFALQGIVVPIIIKPKTTISVRLNVSMKVSNIISKKLIVSPELEKHNIDAVSIYNIKPKKESIYKVKSPYKPPLVWITLVNNGTENYKIIGTTRYTKHEPLVQIKIDLSGHNGFSMLPII